MFDIGFSELVLIAVVALVVLGPERLPKAARTMGHLFGRLQRYVNEVKADISREMELDELRKLQQQVQTAARDLETSVNNVAREVESGVRNVESELNAATAEPAMLSPAVDSPPAGEAIPPQLIPPPSGSGDMPPGPADAPRQSTLPGLDRI